MAWSTHRKADYTAAVTELRRGGTDSEASHIGFFLGISQLMVGQDAAGIERLRVTIALGDSHISKKRISIWRRRSSGGKTLALPRLS